MNNSVKMKIKNKQGKEIVKDVPAELYSTYLTIGWEVVKEITPSRLKPSQEDKLSKNNENL